MPTPPAPFHDNAGQTAFVTQWIQDSNHLGQAAITIENNGFQGDIAGLVQQIQAFAASSNAFDQSQGGLWSARFWNELRTDGTAGTAASALIEGLQTHNAGEINAAAEQLATNAADVASNNLMADGGNYAGVVAAAEATAVTPNSSTPTPPPPDAVRGRRWRRSGEQVEARVVGHGHGHHHATAAATPPASGNVAGATMVIPCSMATLLRTRPCPAPIRGPISPTVITSSTCGADAFPGLSSSAARLDDPTPCVGPSSPVRGLGGWSFD